MIQDLLGVERELVPVVGLGVEAEADWDDLRTPETYVGYGRGERFVSPDGEARDDSRAYRLPDRLGLNHWALAGEWTIGREKVLLDEAGGRIACRFHARDAHLVLSPGARDSIPFRVLLNGRGAGPLARRRCRRERQRRPSGRPPLPALTRARRCARAHAGDHVPRARRRGVRVHVRVARQMFVPARLRTRPEHGWRRASEEGGAVGGIASPSDRQAVAHDVARRPRSQESPLAGGAELGRALAPARGQRVQHHDVQGDHGQ